MVQLNTTETCTKSVTALLQALHQRWRQAPVVPAANAESMNFALLAEVYYFQGDLDRARHFGNLALTFDPPNRLGQAFARLFLGMMYWTQGDYVQARQLLAASEDALGNFNDRGSQMLAM